MTMCNDKYRENLLSGELGFPGTKIFEKYPDKEKAIRRFFKVLFLNYLNENATNALKWYEELGAKVYNDVIRRLSHNGWVISNSLTGRKWADAELCTAKLLEFVTEEELEEIKAEYKYDKYILNCEASTKSTVVRQNGESKYTGLERKGFMAAGNTQFGFDTEMLAKYEETVVKNLTKSMEKVRHMHPEMKTTDSSYDEVSKGIYEWHMRNPTEVFTTGDNINDSRGRAISSCLSKVFNPISNKDARACLVISY